MGMTRRLGFGFGFGWFVVGAIVIVGCGIHRVRPDATVNPTEAYLYGRFQMKGPEAPGMTKHALAVTFRMRCQDGHHHEFGSTAGREVQVLQIAPTRCWLLETIVKDRLLEERTIPVDPSLQRPLDFTAGRAHYLGDYFGKGESEDTRKFFLPGIVAIMTWTPARQEMFLSTADDRYESTTAEMKRAYPNLERLPTVDTRLVLQEERKRDNGVTLAAGEPALSPERVARLAPFIKRNYASPGECEAACPTGQCRPYRGESGPAIACVTLCNADKDCPDGLACNCPTSAGGPGTACHKIAGTAEDRMANICLSVEAGGQRR